MLFSTIVIAISLVGAFVLNWNADWARNLRNTLIRQAPPALVTVSGVVMDPISLDPVPDVDLTVGNTTIHTSLSGYYLFSKVEKLSFITITNPDLKRTFLKTVEGEGRMNIYYNTDMYNLLAQISEMEARKNFTQIYNYLPDFRKEQVSVDDFVKNYKPLFEPEDLLDQQIVIDKTDYLTDADIDGYGVRIPKVVQVDVIKGTNKNSYYFTIDDTNQWRIFK